MTEKNKDIDSEASAGKSAEVELSAVKEEATTSSAEVAPKKSDDDSTLVNGVLLEFTAQALVGRNDNNSLVIKNPQEEDREKNGADVIPLAAKAVAPPSDAQILEAQMKLIAVFISEAKVLEVEMNKLIKVMYAKSPESKPYLLKMKKLIQDHANIEKALQEAKKVS
ncbi:hypothetical protein [Bacteriovorax sp. Seq25_V]|uniref:hypothetical protein n=1 Tax=Bacteriovorax sp. Seq25_V TaxID=1201288 RepID=UPI000389E0B0|nr:hypothetical protein [Bacteriovorax sp. Seq25_V]EQC46547.1 hypothetical protein M900_2451 [Bacteriovorax sp. Seq25_V]